MKYLSAFLILSLFSCLEQIDSVKEEFSVIRSIPRGTPQPGILQLTYDLKTDLYQIKGDSSYYKDAHFSFNLSASSLTILPKSFDFAELSSLVLSFFPDQVVVGRNVNRKKVTIKIQLNERLIEHRYLTFIFSFKPGFSNDPVVLIIS